VLHFVTSYGDLDHQGEAAYYATCLHAAVEFVMRLNTAQHLSHLSDEEQHNNNSNSNGAASLCSSTDAMNGAMDGTEVAEQQQYEDDVAAVAALGEWLREQQTVEDARSLLQQEGWMF